MLKFIKYISAAMITMFAMLIIAEITGSRVHHAASIELVSAFSDISAGPQEGHSNSEGPCQNDETPLEHVIHFHASRIRSNSAFVFLFLTVMSALVDMPAFPRVVIETPLVFENQAASFFLLSRAHSDRAPPVSL